MLFQIKWESGGRVWSIFVSGSDPERALREYLEELEAMGYEPGEAVEEIQVPRGWWVEQAWRQGG